MSNDINSVNNTKYKFEVINTETKTKNISKKNTNTILKNKKDLNSDNKNEIKNTNKTSNSLKFRQAKRMFEVTKISDQTEGGIRKASFQTSSAVCSRQIDIELEGDIVKSVRYTHGCHGNLQGIGALIQGMNKADIISRLEGINCKGHGTSCPDQLSKALKQL